ncbi:MAG: bifunctional DNA primase/polymerase, partial [Candidatus Rokubacteria bacterium]|nr:bifunctional DNA primase/polymerase [Candidatus Rokubacteria bacterium]
MSRTRPRARRGRCWRQRARARRRRSRPGGPCGSAFTGRVSGVVVLDADGEDGLESLKTLQTPVTTWLSRTGRGSHQWFQHPGVTIGNRAGVRPHLDVRGDGGYVVAPP